MRNYERVELPFLYPPADFLMNAFPGNDNSKDLSIHEEPEASLGLQASFSHLRFFVGNNLLWGCCACHVNIGMTAGCGSPGIYSWQGLYRGHLQVRAISRVPTQISGTIRNLLSILDVQQEYDYKYVGLNIEMLRSRSVAMKNRAVVSCNAKLLRRSSKVCLHRLNLRQPCWVLDAVLQAEVLRTSVLLQWHTRVGPKRAMEKLVAAPAYCWPSHRLAPMPHLALQLLHIKRSHCKGKISFLIF